MAEYNGINFDELQNISKKYNTGSVTAWKINRQNLFQVINGNAFFPLKVWPKAITRAFWSKPLSDMQSLCLKNENIMEGLFLRPEGHLYTYLYRVEGIRNVVTTGIVYVHNRNNQRRI